MRCNDCIKIDSCDFPLCGLNSDELEQVSNNKLTNFYKKGQTVNIQGNPVFGVYCLKSGKLKISNTNDEGKEMIIRIAKKGEMVGFRSLFSNEIMNATITAIEDSEVCFFSKDEIKRITKAHPEFTLRLVNQLSKQLGEAEEKISSIAHDPVVKRYANLLLSFSKEYGSDHEGLRKIDIKLTREELASIIGTTSETLTRITTEFRKQKYVWVEGKTFYIKDQDSITKIANA